MNSTVKKFYEKPYQVVIIRQMDENDEFYYVAYHPDLKYCLSDGKTEEEAVTNLDSARLDFLTSQIKRGKTPPEPAYFGPVIAESPPIKQGKNYPEPATFGPIPIAGVENLQSIKNLIHLPEEFELVDA